MDNEHIPANPDSQVIPAPIGEGGNATPAPKAESVDAATWEKRFKDTQAELTRKSQALADIERNNSVLQTEVLKRLAIAVEGRSPSGPTPEELAAHEAELIRELDTDGAKGALRIIKANNEALYAQLKREQDEKQRQVSEDNKAVREELAALRRQADPVYVANRDKVMELVKTGKFTEEQALMAIQMTIPTIPESEHAPAGTSTNRRGTPERQGATEAQVEGYKKMVPDATAAEIEDFRKKGVK